MAGKKNTIGFSSLVGQMIGRCSSHGWCDGRQLYQKGCTRVCVGFMVRQHGSKATVAEKKDEAGQIKVAKA